MSDETSEKKHKPSKKRLEELVKEGNFLRAKEFYSGSTLIVALILLFSLTSRISQNLSDNFYLTYSRLHLWIHEPESANHLIQYLARNSLIALLPFF